MPRINQLPVASSVAQTDVLAIDTPDKTYKVPRSILAPAPYIATIPTGQWSGSGSDRYITVTASNVTANAMLYPFYDKASDALLNGPVWVIPAAGSFTIHTSAIPSGTVTISVLLAGIVGEAQYQVLADVYSKSQVDSIVSQSTAREVVTGSNSQSSVSIPNGAATVCATVSLTSGVWLVIGSGDWAANDTGYRQIAFASGTNPDRRKAATTMGIADKEAYVQVSQIIATSGETVSLYALQNSGAALNVYPFLYAVRLGNVG